jgi:diadenosine tetraphosphatase ApaH/serine/threonine PP2A family protein phosphatase
MSVAAPSFTLNTLTVRAGLHKYSETVYDACIESFCALPVCGLLDSKFFCVHGGISPELNTISDVDRVRIASRIKDTVSDSRY